MEPDRLILLIRCPDQPGLMAATAQAVADTGGNIIHADQHTDQSHGLFLQRVEFYTGTRAPDRESLADAFAPTARRLGMAWSVHATSDRQRIGMLVSREGHCLSDLLSRVELGELHAEAAVVVSNHDALRPLADRFGVPFHRAPVDPAGREAQQTEVVELLRDHEVDLVVLARYMQILDGPTLAAFDQGIINIHHSFLPAFVGARAYHQAHERGVKLIGATAHYATEDLDEGPIIARDVVPVTHRDEVGDLIRKGRDMEKVVLARAVRLHLEHRVLSYANRTAVFD